MTTDAEGQAPGHPPGAHSPLTSAVTRPLRGVQLIVITGQGTLRGHLSGECIELVVSGATFQVHSLDLQDSLPPTPALRSSGTGRVLKNGAVIVLQGTDDLLDLIRPGLQEGYVQGRPPQGMHLFSAAPQRRRTGRTGESGTRYG